MKSPTFTRAIFSVLVALQCFAFSMSAFGRIVKDRDFERIVNNYEQTAKKRASDAIVSKGKGGIGIAEYTNKNIGKSYFVYTLEDESKNTNRPKGKYVEWTYKSWNTEPFGFRSLDDGTWVSLNSSHQQSRYTIRYRDLPIEIVAYVEDAPTAEEFLTVDPINIILTRKKPVKLTFNDEYGDSLIGTVINHKNKPLIVLRSPSDTVCPYYQTFNGKELKSVNLSELEAAEFNNHMSHAEQHVALVADNYRQRSEEIERRNDERKQGELAQKAERERKQREADSIPPLKALIEKHTLSRAMAKAKAISEENRVIPAYWVIPEYSLDITHYDDNTRLYHSDRGEMLMPEPSSISKITGKRVYDLESPNNGDSILWLNYKLPLADGGYTVVYDNDILYVYYLCGNALKTSGGIMKKGEVEWRNLVTKADTKDFDRFNQHLLGKSAVVVDANGKKYQRITPARNTLIGFNQEKFSSMFTDGKNLYDFSYKTGEIKKIGETHNKWNIRIPEGFEYVSTVHNPDGTKTINLSNNSFITYTDRVNPYDASNGSYFFPDTAKLNFTDWVFEKENGKHSAVYFVLDGREVQVHAEYHNIKFPYERTDNPLTLISFGGLSDMNGDFLGYIRDGKTPDQQEAEKRAQLAAGQAQEKKALAAMARKYGKWAEKAAQCKIEVGMPFDLVKKVFQLKLNWETGTMASYTVYYSAKHVTDDLIHYQAKYYGWEKCRIVVNRSTGKVSTIL